MAKANIFEYILLVVGIAAGIIGFKFINRLYLQDGVISWSMVIAIFLWLVILLMFILLSLQVNIAKIQLEEVKKITARIEKEEEADKKEKKR